MCEQARRDIGSAPVPGDSPPWPASHGRIAPPVGDQVRVIGVEQFKSLGDTSVQQPSLRRADLRIRRLPQQVVREVVAVPELPHDPAPPELVDRSDNGVGIQVARLGEQIQREVGPHRRCEADHLAGSSAHLPEAVAQNRRQIANRHARTEIVAASHGLDDVQREATCGCRRPHGRVTQPVRHRGERQPPRRGEALGTRHDGALQPSRQPRPRGGSSRRRRHTDKHHAGPPRGSCPPHAPEQAELPRPADELCGSSTWPTRGSIRGRHHGPCRVRVRRVCGDPAWGGQKADERNRPRRPEPDSAGPAVCNGLLPQVGHRRSARMRGRPHQVLSLAGYLSDQLGGVSTASGGLIAGDGTGGRAPRRKRRPRRPGPRPRCPGGAGVRDIHCGVVSHETERDADASDPDRHSGQQGTPLVRTQLCQRSLARPAQLRQACVHTRVKPGVDLLQE